MAAVKRRYLVSDNLHETLNPCSVTDDHWVWTDGPAELGDTYGKWLVFGKKEGGELDGLWHSLHPLVRSGKLGATGAKCSTAVDSPTTRDKNRGVICVYTTREMRDEVGMNLVHVVKQTIRYKSDEATLQGRYVAMDIRGHVKEPCIGMMESQRSVGMGSRRNSIRTWILLLASYISINLIESIKVMK